MRQIHKIHENTLLFRISIPLSKISLLFVYCHSNLLVHVVLQQLKVFAVLIPFKIKCGTQTSNANESLLLIRFSNHL